MGCNRARCSAPGHLEALPHRHLEFHHRIHSLRPHPDSAEGEGRELHESVGWGWVGT